MHLIPNSYGVLLREFNQCHAPEDGKFCSGEGAEYRGNHTAPMRDSGSPLHDLTGTYPDDVYSHHAVQYYGTGEGQIDHASMALVQRLRGKPNARVTIYRAVPSGAVEEITRLEARQRQIMRRGGAGPNEYDLNIATLARLRTEPAARTMTITAGDWVTINRAYAKEHGEGALRGKYTILKKQVRARDVFTNGDSIHEWGYDPQGP